MLEHTLALSSFKIHMGTLIHISVKTWCLVKELSYDDGIVMDGINTETEEVQGSSLLSLKCE